MADKNYKITFELSDGSVKSVEFTVPQGDTGKSAYEYAKDAGYSGTEKEFAEKLAKESGIDITGATVGQIIKIAAVDDNGKPTAWTAVEFPDTQGLATEEYVDNAIASVKAPTKLSEFENDLYYADKSVGTVALLENKDFEETINEYGYLYTCTIPFNGDGEYEVEISCIANNELYKVKQKAINRFSIIYENGSWSTDISYTNNEIDYLGTYLHYEIYDEESGSVDGNLFIELSIMNDDTEYGYQLYNIEYKINKIETKLIDKKYLDIPNEITNTFVISYDWNTNNYTANYEDMIKARDEGKTLVLYDDANREWQFDQADYQSVRFTKLGYMPNNVQGQKFAFNLLLFFPDGGWGEDILYLG